MKEDITAPVIKVTTAWGLVGITSWADAASALAAVYTTFLLAEWFWKKVLRPYLVSRGWMRHRSRRRSDRR
jgi:hypothetical protein